MKASTVKTAVLCLLLLTTSACKKNLQDESSSVDPVEASLETAMNMVSGLSDDQAGASYALRSEATKPSVIQWLMGPVAYAEACLRAYYATCVNGVKSATYNACDINYGSATLSGSVQLTYSHNSCTLTTNGDSVTRTYDVVFTGPRGGAISHSSALASDYRGTQYGGGGKLTVAPVGWTVDILGRHTNLTWKGRSLYNVSVRTLAPMSITGSLGRNGRILNGGQLEVNHNLAKFTSVIQPNNLQWQSTCCHPVSGSLNISFSGSKSGSATVQFNGCGSATLDKDGQSQDISLSYCE